MGITAAVKLFVLELEGRKRTEVMAIYDVRHRLPGTRIEQPQGAGCCARECYYTYNPPRNHLS